MQTTTLTGVQATSGIGTALAAIGGYLAPAGGATVSHLTIANTSAVTITVSVTLYNGTTDYYLSKGATLAPGDSLNPLGESGQRLVLASGWTVRASASIAGDADATMSVVQYS
jgi:hypothetical protein